MLDMNEEIRAQWCAALRSGEYEQTRGNLRLLTGKDAGHCCLGVLTDLYVKAGHPEEYEGSFDGRYNVWDAGTLSAPVCKWAGLGSDVNPVLKPDEPTHFGTATELNDDGVNFEQIADLIDGGVKPAETE